MSVMPAGWTTTTLGDVALEVRNGISTKPNEDSGLPILRISAVRPMKLDASDVRYLPADFPNAGTYALCTDDLLFTRYNGNRELVGACARVAAVAAGLTYPDKLIRVRLDTRVALPAFVEAAACAQSARIFIDQQLKTSAGQVGVSGADLKRLPLPLAPLAEQQRIADKLDAVVARVDACRDRLARVAPLLKRFRQSVLADAVVGKLTADRRIASASREWAITSLDAVAEVGTGSTPLRSNPAFFAASGTPWITSGATSLPVVSTASEFVTDAAVAAHRLKVYPPGTLLVAMYGEGKTRGQVTELGIAATINQACAAVRVDESQASRAFVKLALMANYLDMRDLAEGGAQPNLNLGKIKSFSLPLPALPEQAEIVRRVNLLFAFADRLEARLAKAQAAADRLTPALLAKAFRGELVPQDPADEPAAELLKRLTADRPAPAARVRRPRAA